MVAYWTLIKPRWLPIIVFAVAAAMITYLLMRFAATPWYRAGAALRPSQRLASEMSAATAAQTLSPLSLSLPLGGSSAMADAEEYITILKSFSFTMALAQRHQLVGEILGEQAVAEFRHSPRLQWQLFKVMSQRFSAAYSVTSFNLELHYEARDPSTAQRILEFYIHDLREQLRSTRITDSAEAISSLKQAIAVTSDQLLQVQLYESLARQMQREKLAQVNADFAFKVLDPPNAPIAQYSPRPMVDSVVAGAAALFAAMAFFLFRATEETAPAGIPEAQPNVITAERPAVRGGGAPE